MTAPSKLGDYFVSKSEVDEFRKRIAELQHEINHLKITHVPAKEIDEWKNSYWEIKKLLEQLGIGVEKSDGGPVVFHAHDSIIQELKELVLLRGSEEKIARKKQIEELDNQIEDLQMRLADLDSYVQLKENYFQLHQELEKLGIGVKKEGNGKVTITYDPPRIIEEVKELVELRKTRRNESVHDRCRRKQEELVDHDVENDVEIKKLLDGRTLKEVVMEKRG
ncbi:MAG: hypothetical protein ACFFD4_02460 [Candidatus Odinarchaeota archaeon]